ncbi:MAG: hypothetical protein M0D54_19820 [Hyphomonadaceae bacterium JAD_PAG50586_4]|nr:MAG: hypothetical protein M0D54_19820 [Hyphomonadaceae bacterium JAD_PAG50586_4]
MEVQQLSLLNRQDEVLLKVFALVDDIRRYPTGTVNEEYMLAYAQWCGAAAFSKLFPAAQIPPELHYTERNVPLENVASKWKAKFPFVAHPAWPA